MLRHPVHVALLFALALTGCARVLTPIGEERYDCNRKEDPSSPYCHSFRGVEEGTAGPMPDSRFDRQLQVGDVRPNRRKFRHWRHAASEDSRSALLIAEG